MASTAKSKPLLRGIVKSVPSGDTMVIMEMGNTASEIPPEKTIILSSIMAPKLARRGGKQSTDEPFAWQSREFLRKLCIGKEVSFQVDYTLPNKGLEFGTVYVGDKNIALVVVAQGWAKVKEARELGKDKGECSPHLKKLKQWEDKAKDQGVGRWSKAAAGAVRNLPPSLVGDPYNFDTLALLVEENKGRRVEAIVEYVRDGSTLHVYLLPDYEHVRVFVAGVQAPSMRNWTVEPEKTEENGKTSNGSRGPLISAQKVAVPSASETKGAPESFGRESQHFTETRVLHRDVRIVLEGIDRHGNLIGRVYYLDGKLSVMDLGEQLVGNGLAKYVDCGNILQQDVKQRLKFSELEAKKSRLRMWNNYVPPYTRSKPIKDQNFTGKVVEVLRGDCIVVIDSSLPSGSSVTKRRVHLSSIRCPRPVNGRSEDKAREFLERHIGHQVHVSMEYSRDVMEFGSVFVSQSRSAENSPLALPSAGSQHHMTNIAEMMLARGYAEVIRHQDFESRSNHYDALLNAECHAKAAKEGMHSDDQYVERRDVSNGHTIGRKLKEEKQVVVKDVLGGGKFYVQLASDQKLASSIQQQLASLNLEEVPAIGSFNPKKGDRVLAQFREDNSWNRAMIVNVPQGAIRSVKAKFEVYYIDYGTQEFVSFSHLRPWKHSVPTSPGLAQLCGLAHVKVPSWEEAYGKEAALCLSNHILNGQEFKAIIEEKDTSVGNGIGTMLMVTLTDTKAEMSINAVMLKEGFARLEKGRGPAAIFAKLERYEEEARKARLGMWENADIVTDDKKPPVQKAGGKK